MKTHLGLVATIAILIAPPLLRADEKPPEAPKRHRGDGRVYEKKVAASIVPPDGWKRGKDGGGMYLRFEGPNEDGRPNFHVQSFAHPRVTIEAMATGFKKSVAGGIMAWETVEENYIQIDGRKAYYIIGRFSIKVEDQTLKMQSVSFVLLGRRGHSITFTTRASKFDDLRKTIEDAAKSFRGD